MAEIQNYAQLRPAAPGRPRRAAPGARAGRRDHLQRADPHIGLLHRATEELAEHKIHPGAALHGRLSYVSMMCNEHAYVMAIEKLLGVEAPLRAQYIRVMFDDHAPLEPPDVAGFARWTWAPWRCSCTPSVNAKT